MSYILDALRKAEQKRQLAAKVPTLATIHRQPAAIRPPMRMRLWPWVAGAVIVVNVGILAWLLVPVGTRSTASVDAPATAAAPATGTVPPAPAPAPGPEVASPTTDAPGASAQVAPPHASATPGLPRVAAPAPATERPHAGSPGATTKANETTPGARTAPPLASGEPNQKGPIQSGPGQVKSTSALSAPGPTGPTRPPPDRPTATPGVPTPAAPPSDQRAVTSIPSTNQPRPASRPPGSAAGLPQEPSRVVQDIVSKLKLQMVVYSEVPSERLVFINNQKYVEGSAVDGTLVVESINPDSAVLTHQGQRFVIRQ